jgi:DNA-binding transcriptional ArsR family regulator
MKVVSMIAELSLKLTAISSPQRIRIVAALLETPLHVSELARRMQLSRAVLYMHLAKLEEAGFVEGHLELSADGKALRYFTVSPFSLTIDPSTLAAVVADEQKNGTPSWT